MNDETRKRLTEFLGECWHEPDQHKIGWHCKHCGKYFWKTAPRRTFTTNDDANALILKLGEKGEWEGFSLWALCAKAPSFSSPHRDFKYAYWLISDPKRLCGMVGEYLKEKGNVNP